MTLVSSQSEISAIRPVWADVRKTHRLRCKSTTSLVSMPQQQIQTSEILLIGQMYNKLTVGFNDISTRQQILNFIDLLLIVLIVKRIIWRARKTH